MSPSAPTTIRVGGSALPDGVMMLTPLAMAIAHEAADGSFTVQAFPLPQRKSHAIDKLPFIRILPKLVGQMSLVVRAWKPGQGKKIPYPLVGMAVVIGVVSGIINGFLAGMPATWYAIDASLIQIGLVLAVVAVTRTVPQFGRIWRFHGGEHQAIAAYEAGLELTVDNTTTRTLYHPRCGTNLAALALLFMIPGMVLSSMISGIFGYLIMVVIPLPALCVAFEIVMLGQNHVRAVLWPGLAFQRLTVARPGEAESLAGIAALKAALEEHARVEAERLVKMVGGEAVDVALAGVD